MLDQNLNKFRLSWTVKWVQQASGPGYAQVAPLGIFDAWCGVPGNILTNMSGAGILVWGPVEASASTLQHS